MEDFGKFLFEILEQFFMGFWRIISNFFGGIVDVFNFPKYVEIINQYKGSFDFFAWCLVILVFIVLIAFLGGIGFLIYLLIRKKIKLYRNTINQDALISEVGKLNAEVIKLSKEKDKILQLKIAGGALNSNTEEDNYVSSSDSRFYKLTEIDNLFRDYDPSAENFNKNITLSELCDMFRNFACSRMGLYYEIRTIRLFISALSSTRLIILQGISGTGKTSLPYAFGKFISNESQIASVQPSWRDRSELFGYFNEFTKRFNETEVLKKMYEASYTDKVYLTILDEMNIARVEYYFAEMLSILEMPSREEWIIDLVPSGWDNDPKHITGGRFKLPENMWYVGTANNDDSTFAISDKVYDRAIPININSKGKKFEAQYTENLNLSSSHLESLFEDAKLVNGVSKESLEKIEQLDDYVIQHFRLAFGNRIVKQLRDFVPVYVACGGTELDGLDYVLANKIFRKFEALNITFIRDEIDGLIDKLSELFGKDQMMESKEYLLRLKKLV